MATPNPAFAPFEQLMLAAGLPAVAIRSFRRHYEQLAGGETGMIPEQEIQPLESLPGADSLDPALANLGREALRATVILKLNGGLGTSMGLEQAKSLIEVKPGHSFLRLLLRQARHAGLPLVLMHSHHTQAASAAAIQQHAQTDPLPEVLRFLQHRAPKIAQHDLAPARWPRNPELEWYPPGHGDLYGALVASGILATLINRGYRYAFVSNSDNLGAVTDERILGFMVAQGASFLMEVTDRTASDRKGGHIAQRPDGGLLLRESGQCPAQDRESFENIERHRFFNTNNLWVDLCKLETALRDRGGTLELPMIRNAKTVDPTDPASLPVYQLESAMGAAIGVIPGAAAICVPRHRFAPVKTTADLLVVRSDVYDVAPSGQLRRREGAAAPRVELDPRYYGRLGDFERRFIAGVPSLHHCTLLSVSGDVVFGPGVVLEGEVRIVNPGPSQRELAGGRTYTGEVLLR